VEARLSDDVLRVGMVGTTAGCRVGAQALIERGATKVLLGAPLSLDPREASRLIAEEIAPHFR
jgi:hypothetical protein